MWSCLYISEKNFDSWYITKALSNENDPVNTTTPNRYNVFCRRTCMCKMIKVLANTKGIKYLIHLAEFCDSMTSLPAGGRDENIVGVLQRLTYTLYRRPEYGNRIEPTKRFDLLYKFAPVLKSQFSI